MSPPDRDGRSARFPSDDARFSVFLGSGGNFDHWGDPATGWVRYIGAPGCNSGSFGDRLHWRAHCAFRRGSDAEAFTEEGLAW